MFTRLSPLLPVLLLSTLSGCWLDTSTTRPDGSGATTAASLSIDHAIAIGVVRLANDPATTVSYLETVVGLDPHVATGIVSQRQGHDALDGTSDDTRFFAVGDLLDVPYVDDRSIDLMIDAAIDEDLVPVRAIEDVWFSATQLEEALAYVNSAYGQDLEELLPSRALDSILAGRPFESMMDVAAAPHVGPAALADLRDVASVGEPS